MDRIQSLRAAVLAEATENILPFSMRHVVDQAQGGFYGHVANDGTADPGAPKGLVQHGRMLWTFAHAGRILVNPEYWPVALHAYTALVDWFHDREHGGFFWTVDHAGHPLDTDKVIYGQAFVLYGLAEQYRAGGDEGCLEQAVELYRLIEARGRDPHSGSYYEVCGRDWTPLPERHLDPTPLPVAWGMNTHLHLLEAYAGLLRALDDGGPAGLGLQNELRASLRALVHVLLERIVDPDTHHMALYFDRDWRPLSDEVSCGHDIEASWLLVEAAEVLGEPGLLARARETALQMAGAVLEQGLGADGGLFDEGPAALSNEGPAALDEDGSGAAAGRDRTWWPQAEAVVGFLNAYQLGGEERFLDASLASWAFIRQRFSDRQYGDWYHSVDAAGRPHDREKAGFWKTPYHNARACFEVLARTLSS